LRHFVNRKRGWHYKKNLQQFQQSGFLADYYIVREQTVKFSKDKGYMDKKQLEQSMQKLINGELNALAHIYEMMSRSVYLLACSILKNPEYAKDVLQETFIKVAANAGSHYAPDTNAVAWISKIARNLSYRAYGAAKKNVGLDAYGGGISDGSDGKNHDELWVENLSLKDAMLSLSAVEREIVTLHCLEGYKHREIAEIVDKPSGTVRWLYRKAIKGLKKRMEEGK